jgi:hypothetical protein
MDVIVGRLTVPDLEELKRQGAAHPVLGRILNGGSWCEVNGIPATAEGVEGIVEAVRAAAAETGLPLSLADDLGREDAAGLERLGGSAALCVIVSDGAGRSRPLAVLYGRSLPALGAIPACTVQDLQSTWISLAGGTPKGGGRHLLHEQPEVWDPDLEQQLTQRLRQLYGE